MQVDAAAARALVPDRFELREAGDKALLAFFTEQCASGLSPALSIDSQIPLERAPFTLTMQTVEPLRFPGEIVSIHCTDGPRGFVLARFSHTPFDVSLGVADVAFGPSPLWVALDASSGPAPGLIASFEWTVIVVE